MPKIFNKVLKPFLQRYSLDWLNEKDFASRMESKIKSHVNRVSSTGLGKKLGISSNTEIKETPLTHYRFYEPFFNEPSQGDFLFPLEDYVRAYTSGTMGKPKTFLLPKTGLWNSISKTGMTFLFLCTHDGEKITYEVGDTVYENMPGGQFISSFYYELIDKRIHGGWVDQVPDVNLQFKAKIDYFVENHQDIDVAYMTVTSLMDQVSPRVNGPIKLKGFITQDRSAYTLKEKIKELTGNYPKTIYGSTETMFSALPSIEHPGGFFFDWRTQYPEFIPEKDAIYNGMVTSDPMDSIINLNQVEKGEIYQLISTPYGNDLIRYVMPDLLECLAHGDNILNTNNPVFRYFSRSDGLLVLHNFTRINEDEITVILGSAGIEFVDFVVTRDLVGSREYLKLYIELKNPIDNEKLREIVNERLVDYDKDWHDLCEMLEYEPLMIEQLPKGAFQRYLEQKVGVPKINRINIEPRNLKLLLQD
jgi:GH3 auxin-responsive promoter